MWSEIKRKSTFNDIHLKLKVFYAIYTFRFPMKTSENLRIASLFSVTLRFIFNLF